MRMQLQTFCNAAFAMLQLVMTIIDIRNPILITCQEAPVTPILENPDGKQGISKQGIHKSCSPTLTLKIFAEPHIAILQLVTMIDIRNPTLIT